MKFFNGVLSLLSSALSILISVYYKTGDELKKPYRFISFISIFLTSLGIYFVMKEDDSKFIFPNRGKGFGKMVTANILRHFSGVFGIAMLKAYPLQHELFDNKTDDWRASMDYDNMKHDFKLDEKSLFKLYKAEGFKRYKRTEYFYRVGESIF